MLYVPRYSGSLNNAIFCCKIWNHAVWIYTGEQAKSHTIEIMVHGWQKILENITSGSGHHEWMAEGHEW